MAEILLIDDMAGVRRAVSAILRRAGHVVATANDGSEGLACIKGKRFDLVITDLSMPEVDGAEVIAYLNALAQRPAILVISGEGVLPETPLQKARLVADAFLEKPFEGADLLVIVARLLAKPD